MPSPSERPMLVLVREEAHRESVLWCAQTIAGTRKARLSVCGQDEYLHEAAEPAGTNQFKPGGPGSDADARSRFAGHEQPAMLFADWPGGPAPQAVLRFAAARNIPAVFVRWPDSTPFDRVVIPTGGGPHALRQVWVANEIASRGGQPAHVLHVVRAEPGMSDNSVDLARETALAQFQARVMGISQAVQVCTAEDVVSGIISQVEPTDLVVLGAPNYWRMAEHFEGSIPDLIARAIPNPLLMLFAEKPQQVRLRDIFWRGTIRLGLKPRDKEEVIATLLDALVANNQVPQARRDNLLRRAVEREQILSTGVGCETAFPHITLPDFLGIVGCMGICPDGVDFGDIGSGRGDITRFVFLLITPEDHYEEYLAVLARIAESLIRPSVRSKLLACNTPAEVLDVLEPEES